MQIFFAQGYTINKIDSLYRVVSHKDAFMNLGDQMVLSLSNEIYAQSKKINYEQGRLNALTKIATVYTNNENFKLAESKISEGILLAEKLNDYHSFALLYNFKARYFMIELEEDNEARRYFYKSLNNSQKLKNQDQKHIRNALVYGDISTLFPIMRKRQKQKILYIITPIKHT